MSWSNVFRNKVCWEAKEQNVLGIKVCISRQLPHNCPDLARFPFQRLEIIQNYIDKWISVYLSTGLHSKPPPKSQFITLCSALLACGFR